MKNYIHVPNILEKNTLDEYNLKYISQIQKISNKRFFRTAETK
jgi:hypothetical protein